MQKTNQSTSGIGPSHFTKRGLFELIKMREKQGRKLRRNFSLNTLDETSRETLVNEAKRVRTPNSWSSYYFNNRIMFYNN